MYFNHMTKVQTYMTESLINFNIHVNQNYYSNNLSVLLLVKINLCYLILVNRLSENLFILFFNHHSKTLNGSAEIQLIIIATISLIQPVNLRTSFYFPI